MIRRKITGERQKEIDIRKNFGSNLQRNSSLRSEQARYGVRVISIKVQVFRLIYSYCKTLRIIKRNDIESVETKSKIIERVVHLPVT